MKHAAATMTSAPPVLAQRTATRGLSGQSSIAPTPACSGSVWTEPPGAVVPATVPETPAVPSPPATGAGVVSTVACGAWVVVVGCGAVVVGAGVVVSTTPPASVVGAAVATGISSPVEVVTRSPQTIQASQFSSDGWMLIMSLPLVSS